MQAITRIAAAACLLVTALSPSSADAKSPAGRYVVNANATTVLDTTAGLTWMRKEACCVVAGQAEKQACTDSTLEGGGWRAPTLRELAGILDRSYGWLVDTTVFAGLNAEPFKPFLTSTQHFVEGKGLMMRGISLAGGTYKDVLPTDSVAIRCVRK